MRRPGTLLVVGTPLGHLQDITPRALEALRRAAVVACEDTRHTRGLLSHFGIAPPQVISYHKFNERRRLEPVLAVLRQGGDVALVSDGGTPGLSDPGAILVSAALDEGLPVSPVPGPSAVAAAISACGMTASAFVFVGFLPPKATARRKALADLAAETRPMVFFEAPHRVAAAVFDMKETLGDRRVTLLREMTKLHEEVTRMTLGDLAQKLSAGAPRGEFTLVVEGAALGAARSGVAAEKAGTAGRSPGDTAALRRRYRELLAGGTEPRAATRIIMKETGLSRRDVYAAARTERGAKDAG